MSETQNAGAPAEAPAEPVTIEQVDSLLEAQAAEEEREPFEGQEAAPAEQPPAEPQPAHEPPGGDLRVALREERDKRRQIEQRAIALDQERRAVASALQAITSQFRPQQAAGQPQPPAVPDFEVDPAANLKAQIEELRGVVGQMTAAQQQAYREAQQQAAKEQQESQVKQYVNTTEAQFAQTQPDYYDAVGFMRERLAKKFEVLGVPKEQLAGAVDEHLKDFGRKSAFAGQNPAQSLFQLARIEGYNGAAKDVADRLNAVAAASAATRGARSSAPASDGKLTPEAAARLSIKDFQKMSEEQFRTLMGG